MDAKIYLVSSDAIGMAAAAGRLIDKLDALCVAKLEAQVVEFTCPDIDVPPLPYGDCCGPWTTEFEMTPFDAKALAAALAPMPTIKHLVAEALREQPRHVARHYVPKKIGTPYRGYASTYRRHRR